jgi:hypothetical protein
MKRYKYQATITLPAPKNDDRAEELRGPTRRMVVRADHQDSRASRIFSALVTPSEELRPDGAHVVVTLVVLGEDVTEYLAPGTEFTLWLGHDVGHGTVTRRIFV